MPKFKCPKIDLFIFIFAWATVHCLGVTFGNCAVGKYFDCTDLRVDFDKNLTNQK